MLPILLSLTALAADIVIDNKPFTAVSGVARANPDQPGALQISPGQRFTSISTCSSRGMPCSRRL